MKSKDLILEVDGEPHTFYVRQAESIEEFEKDLSTKRIQTVVNFAQKKYGLKDDTGKILAVANDAYYEYMKRHVESRILTTKRNKLKTPQGIQRVLDSLPLMLGEGVE